MPPQPVQAPFRAHTMITTMMSALGVLVLVLVEGTSANLNDIRDEKVTSQAQGGAQPGSVPLADREPAPRTQHTAHSNSFTPVLIVALGRVGSTLLTDMMVQNRTDVFGIYEPFHDFPEITSETKALGSHGIPKALNWGALFDCTFPDHHQVLGHVGWRGQGRHKLADQIRHLKPWPEGGRRWGDKPRRFQEERLFRLAAGVGQEGFDNRYAPYIRESCRASRIRVVKTIRLSGPLLDHFIETGGSINTEPTDPPGPPLKVIHLIRNPADVSRSWQRFTKQGRWKGSDGVFDFDSRTRLMCRKGGDVIFGLNSVIPRENQLVVRFEDLTLDPIATMRRVFKFIGASFEDGDIATIHHQLAKSHGPQVGDHHVVRKFGVFGDAAVSRANRSSSSPDATSAKDEVLSTATVLACGPIAAIGDYNISQS